VAGTLAGQRRTIAGADAKPVEIHAVAHSSTLTTLITSSTVVSPSVRSNAA
jgi:hypothetical protein